MKGFPSTLVSVTSFALGLFAAAHVIDSLAPELNRVACLGGLVPGKAVFISLLLVSAVKVFRSYQSSHALTQQTGTGTWGFAFAGSRSVLEGALIAFLAIGLLNPATKPGPKVILDLPHYEKDNWKSESELLLAEVAAIAKKYQEPKVRVQRVSGRSLVEDTDFQKATDLIGADGVISAACRQMWNRAIDAAHDDSTGPEDRREIRYALWLICEDLEPTASSSSQLGIADQQEIYIVSRSKPMGRNVDLPAFNPGMLDRYDKHFFSSFDEAKTTSRRSIYPVPSRRGVRCYWEHPPQTNEPSEPGTVGVFWTQSPIYPPRFVLTISVPPSERIPEFELARFVGGKNGVNMESARTPSAEIPAKINTTEGTFGPGPYLEWRVSRVGSSVCLQLQGPALNEDFGTERPFDWLSVKWTSKGEVFNQPFKDDYAPDRLLRVIDEGGVVSAKLPEIAKYVKLVSGYTPGTVRWGETLASGTQPQVQVQFHPLEENLPTSELQSPILGGAQRPEFERGWRFNPGGVSMPSGTIESFFLAQGTQKIPVAWLVPKSPSQAALHFPTPPDPSAQSWLTGNHRQAMVHMLLAMSIAARDPLSNVPGAKATARQWFRDERESELSPIKSASNEVTFFTSLRQALWPEVESKDFYIPAEESCLRDECWVGASWCLAGIFGSWALAMIIQFKKEDPV